MAWIYFRASEESQRLSTDTLPPSPIVKTTDTLKLCCSLECIQESCRVRPFGTMCEHCEDFNCYGPWTWSTAVSPVRTLAVQDAEQAWRESAADYFSRSLGSLAKYDQDSCSWRIPQLSGL